MRLPAPDRWFQFRSPGFASYSCDSIGSHFKILVDLGLALCYNSPDAPGLGEAIRAAVATTDLAIISGVSQDNEPGALVHSEFR